VKEWVSTIWYIFNLLPNLFGISID